VQERTAELNKSNHSLRDLSAACSICGIRKRGASPGNCTTRGAIAAAINMNLGVVNRQIHKLDEAGARAVTESRAAGGANQR